MHGCHGSGCASRELYVLGVSAQAAVPCSYLQRQCHHPSRHLWRRFDIEFEMERFEQNVKEVFQVWWR